MEELVQNEDQIIASFTKLSRKCADNFENEEYLGYVFYGYDFEFKDGTVEYDYRSAIDGW